MTKQDPKALVTNEILGEAVQTILERMDNMFKEERKYSSQTFATKEDLSKVKEEMVTKEDLKREVSWLRDDIGGLTADLSGVPTKKEFNELKGKVDKYSAS
ncbi:hypothetical protein HY045_01365 [Candidatus Woesebacteria bacterium]|nr:hypothetical protein [Candidatus Woesebacteria bacterium]